MRQSIDLNTNSNSSISFTDDFESSGGSGASLVSTELLAVDFLNEISKECVTENCIKFVSTGMAEALKN